jgi:hypothetical protein
MDDIFQESLGNELIEEAPRLIDMFKSVVSHSVADTRVDGNKVRFTINKRRINYTIKRKVKEVVSEFFNENAKGIGTVVLANKGIATTKDNMLHLDGGQLPADAKHIGGDDNYSVFISDSIVDHYGKSKVLVTGDIGLASEALGITEYSEVSSEAFPLSRDLVLATQSDKILNAYLGNVILSNFDSIVKNVMPILHESHAESFRKGSVDIIDSISGNQAKAITRANIITTPKLSTPSKDDLNKKVNAITKNIRGRGTKTIADVINESGIVETVAGDRPLLRVRMNDGTFEDIVVLRIGNKRYPLVLDRELKSWKLITQMTNKGFEAHGIEDGYLPESKLLMMLNKIFQDKNSGIKQAKDLFDRPTEVNIGSVAVTLNNMASSIKDANSGLDMLEASENSFNKFLTEEEVESLSAIFINLPQDLKDAGDALKAAADESYGAEAEILRGLYYKFFHPKEYYISQRNPVTGKMEVQKHNSFYRISKLGLGKESTQALDQLVALKSMLNTVAPNEFINMMNGTGILSNTLGGDTIKNNFDNIDNYNTILQGSVLTVRDSAFSKFKVSEVAKTGEVKIRFNKKEITLTPNSTSKGNAFIVFPFTIQDLGGMTFSDMEAMLRALGLPTKFATQDFLTLTEGAISTNDIKNFIATMISLKLANGNGKNYRKSKSSILTRNLLPSDTGFVSPKYQISRHLPTDFKESLGTILDKFEGLSVRKFVVDHERNRRMTTATVNKALRIKQAMKEAELAGVENLYQDSS